MLKVIKEHKSKIVSLFRGEEMYFSAMLLSFTDANTVYDLDSGSIAAVGVTKNKNDLILYLNPILFIYPKEVIKFVLQHEIMHVLLGHLSVRFSYVSNQYLANIAKDCAINQLLKVDSGSIFKDANDLLEKFGGVSLNSVKKTLKKAGITDDILPRESSEYYYDLLMTGADVVKSNNDKSNPLTNGAANDTNINGDSTDSKSESCDGNSSKTSALNQAETSEDIDWTFDSPSTRLVLHHPEECEGVSEAQAQAMSTLLQSRSDKSIPSDVLNVIKKSFETYIPWQDKMKNKMATIVHGIKKTFLRANRRHPELMYLRGQLSKRTCNIKVVIDTSGSVVNLAGYFFSEIEKIFKDFPVIEVAEVDTEVRRTYKMDKRTNLTEAEGGGGTILEPGIKHFSTSKKDKADVIIIFTDGYCESHIDNPKVPLIWVVLDNANNLNTNPYYGEIIVMDTSKIKQ
jgi:predicted metal-dependent peptidase